MPRQHIITLFCSLLLLLYGCSDTHGCDRAYDETEKLHQQLRESIDNHDQFLLLLDQLENRLFEVIKTCADDARPLTVMSQVQITAGQPSLAMAYAQKAHALNPDIWQSQYAMASALSLLQEYAKAVPHAERASQLAPERPGLTLGLCRAYSQAGSFQQAMQTCSNVINGPAKELHATAYFLRGKANEGLGDNVLAEADYKQAEALGYPQKRK